MRTGGQRSLSPQLIRFSNESPQLKQVSPPLYRTRQPRYTIPHICGHRQVVRHQLPKLTLAGSSPVARSKKAKARHHHGAVLFFNKAPGLEPARVRTLSKREAFVASRRRRRQAPEAGADLRSKYADVPLPAPPSTGDLGNVGSNPLCPCMCADRACRSQPVRICEANTQTSRCPLHQPRSISGTTDSTGFAPRVSPDPGLSTAAGAYLRSKYADVPLLAPISKC